MEKPTQKEGQSHENPTAARTEKSPLSERNSTASVTRTDEGVAKEPTKKPSVKEKLERFLSADYEALKAKQNRLAEIPAGYDEIIDSMTEDEKGTDKCYLQA